MFFSREMNDTGAVYRKSLQYLVLFCIGSLRNLFSFAISIFVKCEENFATMAEIDDLFDCFDESAAESTEYVKEEKRDTQEKYSF